MKLFNSNTIFLRFGISILIYVSMAGCGGGSDNSAITNANIKEPIADVVVGVEVEGSNNVLVNYRNVLALTAAGITIVEKKCFFHNITLNPPGPPTNIGVGSPANLYIYTIQATDLAAAVKLGFKTDFIASDFKTEISCTMLTEGVGTIIQ